MPIRNAKAVFRYRRFSLTTKVVLSTGIIFGAVLGCLPGNFKYRIHWELWNLADIGINADYWFAILHLAMPWAYAVSGTDADAIVIADDVRCLEATHA